MAFPGLTALRLHSPASFRALAVSELVASGASYMDTDGDKGALNSAGEGGRMRIQGPGKGLAGPKQGPDPSTWPSRIV